MTLIQPQFDLERSDPNSLERSGRGGALTLCFLVGHLYLGYILGLEFTNCAWSHNIMHLNYFKVWQLFSWEVHNMTDSSQKPNLPDECVTPLLSCYLMATIRAVKRGQLSSASNTVFPKDSPFMIKKPSSQYCAMLKCLVKALMRPLGFLTLYLAVMKKLE